MVGKEVAFNFQRILFSVENKRFIVETSDRNVFISITFELSLTFSI